eukprot:1441135-Rhodomonas_salina.1
MNAILHGLPKRAVQTNVGVMVGISGAVIGDPGECADGWARHTLALAPQPRRHVFYVPDVTYTEYIAYKKMPA